MESYVQESKLPLEIFTPLFQGKPPPLIQKIFKPPFWNFDLNFKPPFSVSSILILTH